MILACLLATLAVLPQEPPREPTMVERIDALIAKSNAYEGFVAVYHLLDKDGPECTLRIIYRSPQEFVMDVQAEGFRSFTHLRESTREEIHRQGESSAINSSVKDWDPSIRYDRCLRGLLDQAFPGCLRADELPECKVLFVNFRAEPGGKSMSFNCGFGPAKYARLGWLEDVRRLPDHLRMGGQTNRELLFSLSDGSSMVISPVTGFVTRIERQTDEGARVGVELVSLDTNARPLDSEFELPNLGEGVRDSSEELARQADASAFLSSRAMFFRMLARMIDDGRVKWTDDFPPTIEHLIRALHAVDFAPLAAERVAVDQAWIDHAVEDLRERFDGIDLDDPTGMTQAREAIRAVRTVLENSLQRDLDDGFLQQTPHETCKTRPSLYEDLGALDKRVLADVFGETVSKPILASFDEKVSKLLDK
jgi:hypothetical protein